MSFTEGHVLCCDCDECLNRGGGTPSASTRVERTPRARSPSWRQRATNEEVERLQLAGIGKMETKWSGW